MNTKFARSGQIFNHQSLVAAILSGKGNLNRFPQSNQEDSRITDVHNFRVPAGKLLERRRYGLPGVDLQKVAERIDAGAMTLDEYHRYLSSLNSKNSYSIRDFFQALDRWRNCRSEEPN